MQISVVIPAKNEQGNVSRLIEEIHEVLHPQYQFEIVLTDDGSADNTVDDAIQAAERLGTALQVFSHADSCGQSTAVHTAVHHARGHLIATLDADGQNDPHDIPSMIEKAFSLENEHFCIAGYRKGRKDTPWVRFQSKVANRVRHALLKDGVPDSGCGLKVFPRHTFVLLPYFDHMHRFLPALIRRLNGKIVIHPVNHRDRIEGVSKYTVWNRLWVGIVDLIGVAWLIRRTKWPTIKRAYRSNE